VLAFDAFARCWVQEGVLLEAIAAALPAGQRSAMEPLQAAWQAARRQTFAESMAVLARSLAVTAIDRQPVDDGSFLDGLRTQLREISSRVRGTGRSWVTWNAAVLDGLVAAALLRYLAVAHFGRGRGEWRDTEVPPHWPEVVEDALASLRDSLAALWAGRPADGDDAVREEAIGGLAARLEPLLAGAASAALEKLYPATVGQLAGARGV
jgi:hypothetical protein